MKKEVYLTIVLLAFLGACKKEKPAIPAVPEKPVTEAPVVDACYLGILKKDTVAMSLRIKGNQVLSGELRYNYFEKDKNTGTLTGEIKGDTLLADYTFMSEGVTSVRQVAFLKKGNTYTEGYGETVTDADGKVSFKNSGSLQYGGGFILSGVDCKE